MRAPLSVCREGSPPGLRACRRIPAVPFPARLRWRLVVAPLPTGPVDLLALVLVIAAMWPPLTHELAAEVRTHSQAHRRKAITDAVTALTAV